MMQPPPDTLVTVVDASVFLELFGTDADIINHGKLAFKNEEDLKMDGSVL